MRHLDNTSYMTLNALGLGQVSTPIPVQISQDNTTPHWVFWIAAVASVGSLIILLTSRK